MKRIVLTAAFAALGSASALAADLPSRTYAKAPAMAAPAYNWSGWYGGLNAGWVGGSGSVSNDASIVSTSSIPANAQARPVAQPIRPVHRAALSAAASS